MMLSELSRAVAEPAVPPAVACAQVLLAMVPAFGVYRQYVGGRSASAAALQALRQEGGPTVPLLEADYGSCSPPSAREDTYSAVLGGVPLCSLHPCPSYSRGALETLHSAEVRR